MPERKGRKRKPQRLRRDGDSSTAIDAVVASAGAHVRERSAAQREASSPESTIPALRARYAGFIVAMLTLMIGAVTAAQGITGDHAAPDKLALIATGIALILLAGIIGALALIPARIAAWLRR